MIQACPHFFNPLGAAIVYSRRAAKLINRQLFIHSRRRMTFRRITICSQESKALNVLNHVRTSGQTIEKLAPRGDFVNLQRGA
jgi:hypothetical protein